MVATTATTARQGVAGRVVGMVPVAATLTLMVAVFAVVFMPSIRWMCGEWSSSAGVMSHGYLIAAIGMLLFVRAVPAVAQADARPCWWALPALLGLSITWLLGFVATVVAVQTLVLPAILITAIIAAFGLQAARPLVFPVFFMYFAIPAWQHLQFIFQAITVAVVTVMIRLADIPALIDGNLIRLSAGTFEIAGGCSGLAFIISGLSLAVLYGHLFYSRTSQSLRLIGLTLFVAMLGNWIRVFAIIVIGYRTNMQSPLVADHLTLGWVLFAVLMIPVYVVARRIEEHARRPQQTLQAARTGWGSLLPAVFASLVMAAGPAWALGVSHIAKGVADPELNLPDGTGHWPGPSPSHWEWSPKFAGPLSERVAQYGTDKSFVLAYTNLYLSQAQGRELVYFSNRVAGDWPVVTVNSDVVSTVVSRDGLEFRQVAARNYLGTWLIWYRYQVDERFTAYEVQAKILQALSTLHGRPMAGVVAFATPCRASCDLASETLSNFVAQVGNTISVDYSREQQ